jgi:hypothetical protein
MHPSLHVLFTLSVSTLLCGACSWPSDGCVPAPGALRATELIWVADDFVVDLWHNGRLVPSARRELRHEIFGATVERADVTVRAGDWLCFHVVNNRMRWGGCRYFAVAGRLAPGEFGFESDPGSPLWSACDDPAQVAAFVAGPHALAQVRAHAIVNPWDQGAHLMQSHCGPLCRARPLWGEAASTWLKVRVE